MSPSNGAHCVGHLRCAPLPWQPLEGVNRAWDKVRVLAGIPDVRLHDLRHSFATFAVENGASLFQIGRTLGHAKSVSTERYVHPTDAGAREVASGVAARFILPAANGPAPPSAESDQAMLPLDLPIAISAKHEADILADTDRSIARVHG